MYELIEYSCFNCHTKFLTYKTIIDKCPNCDLNSFKITKKEFNLDIFTGKINYSNINFLDEINKVIKKYPFLPDEFLKLKRLNKTDIKTFYIPAILYNSKLNIFYSSKLINKKSKLKFNDILLEYSNIDKNNLVKIKPFNTFEINKYELDLENIIIEEIDDNIKIKEDIRNKLIKIYDEQEFTKLNKKYQDGKIINSNYKFLDEESKLVYLPIYLYSFNYQDKVYRFLMNANTGKFTYEIINSKLKIILFLLSILIFTCLFTYCMHMLFESNAFKRWFCYLIILDILLLIWLFRKCKTEVIPINKQSLIYEIIEELEGD
ncbi:MAG: hypothetical protein IJ501_02585 [Bacilli bacterium]|nr:hypothetical protein [Bacilli bacterium]